MPTSKERHWPLKEVCPNPKCDRAHFRGTACREHPVEMLEYPSLVYTAKFCPFCGRRTHPARFHGVE